MSISSSLKPCPFCGGTNLVLSNLVDDDDFFVSCQSCFVQQTANYREAEAVAKWNTRAGGWLPADTAPLNEPVLAFFPTYGPLRSTLIENSLGQRWATLSDDQPTHWQPLPDAPEISI